MVKTSSLLTQQNLYHVPIYTIADTARYLHIPLPTLKTWVNGRSYPTQKGDQDFLPLIQRPQSPLDSSL
ncbi:hypothetical protein [Limnospira platensis]|uniref:hypothetical protein n=1 Tax=Limnospira platensis TaxID=118562 RepID=UPI0025704CF6